MLIAGQLKKACFVAFAHTLVLASVAEAQWISCERATNGRPYCQASSDGEYSAVSEQTFNNFKAARQQTSGTTRGEMPSPKSYVPTGKALKVIEQVGFIQNQYRWYKELVEVQEQRIRERPKNTALKSQLGSLKARLSELASSVAAKKRELTDYSTPIRPDDFDQYVTVKRLSETQVKVPYYIPGTKEVGEFWVEPVVSDEGVLQYKFQFVDTHSLGPTKVRSSILMSSEDIESTGKAMMKGAQFSQIAHKHKLRRRVSKRITCFPAENCPPEGGKLQGKASTELIFLVYENGSTAIRIQRNKGTYEEGYNISIKSGHCLEAYINYISKHAKSQFKAGSMTDSEVKDLFKSCELLLF